MSTDFYDLLKIPKAVRDYPDPEFEAVLRKAYYSQAKLHHPDKCGGSEESTARFKEIQIAYDTLKDPRIRKAYDERQTKRPTTAPPSAAPQQWHYTYSFPSFEDIEEDVTIHKTRAMKEYHLKARDLEGLYYWTVPSTGTFVDKLGQRQRYKDAHIYWLSEVKERAIELHGGTWEAHLEYLHKYATIAKKCKETRMRNKHAKERGIETPNLPTPKKSPPRRERKTSKPTAASSSSQSAQRIPSPPATPPRTPKRKQKRKADVLEDDDADYQPASTVDKFFPATPRSLRPRWTTETLRDPPSPPDTPTPVSKKRRTDVLPAWTEEI